MKSLFFEEYEMGMVSETGRRTVTDYDVSTYIGLAGYRGPMWYDLEYAAKDAYYGGRLVPGMLVLTLAEGLVIGSGIMEDRGLALMEVTPKFRKPVLVGDTIYTSSVVTGLHLTSRGDRGVVTTDNSVLTTSGKTAVEYQAVRMIRGKAFSEETKA
ncbi:acyl dehydratase [Amycolatopsis acidicola]|uniref:Acyl dehydratase n=1 Tax=Amycolatopsis acidicola TaxID=2596893 RepID=A0A5N0VF48_9PSEU|nr:MaoC/PaaZ C-terminal domain-containing protein [Amycolatopsis acidicola]KAA9163312.1 acyl dehydratase [Amycolatopsis acidicola]